MKKIKILLAIILISSSLSAQKKDFFLTDIRATIYSSVFDESKEKLNLFIKKSNAEIIEIDEKQDVMEAEFYLTERFIKELDTLIENLGHLNNKKTKTNNFNERVKEINMKIKYHESKKQAYEDEIKSMDKKEKRYYDKYYTYWDIIRNIEKTIFNLKKDLSAFRADKKYKISITIYDDTIDLTNQKVNWVNMPGVSAEILFVENPLANLSAEQYMGYSLNYLITKGKTHFTLGVLKKFSNEEENDLRYNELFHFGFGQDFYTKHFGRGKRQWFNLYTGYNMGGIFATSETSKRTLPYMKVFIGFEFFKNKYILIDNKVGYFIPFKHNKNLRGISYSFSLNFVF